MIRTITQHDARLLAIRDALRAMEQSDYDGVSNACSEGFDDHRFEGLGDVILLNPGVQMSEPNAQTDDLHIIREVHLNYSQDRPVQAPLTDSDAAAAFLRGVISDTTREHAVAIYLDPKNRPLGWRIVSIGTDVSAPVKPLLVLQPAVLLGANAMIFAQPARCWAFGFSTT
jgi:hypothetical protein